MSNQVACPICGGRAEADSVIDFNLGFYECQVCGKFIIGAEYLRKIDLDLFAPYLFYNCNLFSPFNETDNIYNFIGSKETFNILHEHYTNTRLLDIQEIANWYPKTFSEKIDLILLGLAQLSDYTGKTIILSGTLANSLYFIKRFIEVNNISKENIREQVIYYTGYLTEEELIKSEYSDVIVLLPKGLKRIDELQRNKSNSKQAFVAMAFSDDTKLLREALREGIKRAGYIARFIDEKKHNNQIVPEILYLIKQCKFIIAEFSDNNNGAYYEAGYAAGLGKEVIHVCNEEKFRKKGHFDIKQKSTILWKSLDELPDSLHKHIEATIT
jgi:nucleoside 2-deoxyribosyltransferase